MMHMEVFVDCTLFEKYQVFVIAAAAADDDDLLGFVGTDNRICSRTWKYRKASHEVCVSHKCQLGGRFMSYYTDSARRCDSELVIMFGNFSTAQSWDPQPQERSLQDMILRRKHQS